MRYELGREVSIKIPLTYNSILNSSACNSSISEILTRLMVRWKCVYSCKNVRENEDVYFVVTTQKNAEKSLNYVPLSLTYMANKLIVITIIRLNDSTDTIY